MYTFDEKAFSERLKTLISDKGFTQEQFAKKSDVSLSTLKTYLNGQKDKDGNKKISEPTATNLYRMAAALNTSVESLLQNDDIDSAKEITPKDIINAINTLTEAYGYECIEEKEFTDVFFDEASGYPRNTTVKHNAICINEDKKVQWYLQQLRTKGHLKFELSSVGESEAYSKLLKQWANIDGCIFENGFIYNPQTEEIYKDKMGNLYIDEKLPF